MKDAKSLRWDLKTLGLSETAIDAAWPEWWSDAAEPSISAQSELRFSLSRKLGLEPQSLLDDEPRFLWRDQAKFKRLTSESQIQQAAIVSFGASVGRALLAATAKQEVSLSKNPTLYRELILRHAEYVDLKSLLTLCWGVGIPIIHLRIFPLAAKMMTAMVVRVNHRFAILLAKDASYPAVISFYLAHELAHAALGHIQSEIGVVEFGDSLIDPSDDEEELAADRYALELLTGMQAPNFVPKGTGFNAPSLANAALNAASGLRIDPGVIALCFGHSTRAWQRVFSSLRMIYGAPRAMWSEINSIAEDQLDWDSLNDDIAHYLRAVLGRGFDGERGSRQ